MFRSGILCFLLVWMPAVLMAQNSFEELVERTIGSDQGLVNGIQFSNQYIRIYGNPYFMEGRYRVGSVCISEHWHEYVLLRYNLFTQKVEIEYLSPEGNMNQLITVPEQMSAFLLEGYEFRRMQIEEDDPMYYMVLSAERISCYVGWTVNAKGGGSSQRTFTQPMRIFWIQQGEQFTAFHDRKSYIRAFPPERKKEFRNLLKWKKFYFNQASTHEVVDLIWATFRLYEEGEGP